MTDVCAVSRDRKVGRVMDLCSSDGCDQAATPSAAAGHYRANQHLGHLEDLVII